MSTTFRTKSAKTYKNRYTVVQLASTIRQLKTQYAKLSNQSYGNTTSSKTCTKKCNAIANEIKKVAVALRYKTVQQITAKIRTLRSQYAAKIGVSVSSPKTKTTAVKRLQVKIKQINKANRISKLVKLATGVKLATFKNPVVRSSTTTKRSVTTGRRTTTRTHARRRTTGGRSTGVVSMYKRKAKTIKKQFKKPGNTLKRLVNKVRRKAATLTRSYRAANARPRWTVYQGQGQGRGTSNVVRFNRNRNRSSSSNWTRQAQRRVG